MGYMQNFGGWVDIHGAGCQRSDPKPRSLNGLTKNGNGYYNAQAPQGDAVRIYNYVRLVRNIDPKTDVNDNVPSGFALEQNFPNPFSNSTTIKYDVTNSGNVSIILFDTFGSEITTVVNQYQQAGEYFIQIDSEGLNLSNGIYFYRMTSGTISETKTMILNK